MAVTIATIKRYRARQDIRRHWVTAAVGARVRSRLRAAARAQGVTVSEWIYQAVLEKLRADNAEGLPGIEGSQVARPVE